MSETEERDGATIQFPPPLVPVVALGVGVIIQRFVHPLPALLGPPMNYVLGWVLVAGGLALMLAAMRLFQRTGQDPKPWKSTPEIIATGIYRFTRNPMYLGMGALQAGIGFLLSNLWVVGLVPVTWIVIYATAIRHEEVYLERKFGSSYVDYKNSVRRWL